MKGTSKRKGHRVLRYGFVFLKTKVTVRFLETAVTLLRLRPKISRGHRLHRRHDLLPPFPEQLLVCLTLPGAPAPSAKYRNEFISGGSKAHRVAL